MRTEVATYKLHPSVLDNALNLISQTSGDTYLPFSYKSFRLFAPLGEEIFSYVVKKTDKLSAETVAFDVTLTDQDGRVLGRIEDYIVKKVSNFAELSDSDGGADGEYLLPTWVAHPEVMQEPMTPTKLLCLTDSTRDELTGLRSALAATEVAVDFVHLGDGPSEFALDATSIEAIAQFVTSDALAGVEGIIFAIGANHDDLGTMPLDQIRSRRATSVDALFNLAKGLLEHKVSLPLGLTVLSREAYAVDGSELRLDPFGAAVNALGSTIHAEYGSLPCRLIDAPIDWGNTELLQPHSQCPARQAGRIAPSERPAWLPSSGNFSRGISIQVLMRYRLPDGLFLLTGGLGGLGLATARDLAERGVRKLVLLGRSAIAPRDQWQTLATDSSDVDSASQTLPSASRDRTTRRRARIPRLRYRRRERAR